MFGIYGFDGGFNNRMSRFRWLFIRWELEPYRFDIAASATTAEFVMEVSIPGEENPSGFFDWADRTQQHQPKSREAFG